MATRCFHSTKPDAWTLPRPTSDPVARRRAYGPIKPMDEEAGVLHRMFRW